MKRLTMATMMLLATGTFALAQAPAAEDPHHPQGATSAPAQPAPPNGQPGMGQGMMGMQGMPMMNMMGNMPMMGMMHRMHSGMSGCEMDGLAATDRIEGRIAFLRAELKITEAQAGAWNALAEAMRANAKQLGAARAAMTAPPKPAAALADRLEAQERWLAARLEGTRAIRAALIKLEGMLTDEQKKTANELLAPHTGMMAMMPGMQPGQMQPGQMMPGMQPGQMQPGQMQKQMMPGMMQR